MFTAFPPLISPSVVLFLYPPLRSSSSLVLYPHLFITYPPVLPRVNNRHEAPQSRDKLETSRLQISEPAQTRR